MKRLWLAVLAVLLLALLLQGCGSEEQADKEKKQTIILYSELEPKLSLALAEAYSKSTKGKTRVKLITELQEDGIKPDLVIAEKKTLNGLLMDGRLQVLECAAGRELPEQFRQPEGYWYGAFYDPTVFLVNQEFSRRVGQENIRSWEDLLRLGELRLVMENLTNTNSTKNFLGGFTEARGEAEAMSYLWNINSRIVKYANFPFSPVRMVAMGQADVAVTRQSYVYKYLESSFPAYIVQPREGSPVNLYGVGCFKEAQHTHQVAELMDWLITSREMQRISRINETGYSFILAQATRGERIDYKKLWLNNKYLVAVEQERLTGRWLEIARFADR